jgi:nitrogen PTS system EIIA component
MLLTQFLDFDAIKPALVASSKRGLFTLLGQAAAPATGLQPAEISLALTGRERAGSTGFGNGVAIPHARLDGLKRIYAMVARLPSAIDYKAIDEVPVDLVFLLLSPPDAGPLHLKALAAISRVVRHAPTLEQLRGAKSRDALAAVLMGVDEAHVA